MPNWVTNRIVFHGNQENIDRVLRSIKGNRSKIDFNKIIPMPDNIYRNVPHSTTRIRCGLIRRGAALYPYSISLQKYVA